MSDTDRLRELFLDALELPVGEQAAFLDRACSDPELRVQVASLLEHHARAATFLTSPLSDTPLFSQDERALPVIEGFEVVREIGRGGMGVVYLARDPQSDREVALKVLQVGLTLSETGLARFRTEARTMSRLDHPSIVRVVRFDLDTDPCFIASDYIEGSTLARELDMDLRLGIGPRPGDWRAIARFVAKIADALAHAHAHNVLHRDVKPSNILIDLEGRPHLADFGLARDLEALGQTRSGDRAGTLAYMSPEQALGRWRAVDHRTDVYATGVVLFELLVGRRPFDTPSAVELARTIADRDVEDPRARGTELPAELWTLCQKALEKDPRDRFADIAELARDLEAFAAGRPIRTRPLSLPSRVRRGLRRHRLLAFTVAAGIVLAALGLAWGISTQRPSTTPLRVDSEPRGAQVFVQRLVVETGDYGPLQRLGTTPLSTRVQPGLVRLVLRDAEGRAAELSRSIPAPTALEDRARMEVHARLLPRDIMLSEMVPFEDFALDRHEVTVEQYRRFAEATDRHLPKTWAGLDLERAAHLPAPGLAWEDGRDYAESVGKRLPTLREWERAANVGDGRAWPWGAEAVEPDSLRVWACVDRHGGEDQTTPELFLAAACPPGQHPRDRSPEGVEDLLGSVREWVDTPWRSSGSDGRLFFDENLRLAVGSSWSTPLRGTSLQTRVPVSASVDPPLDFGLRCAISLGSDEELDGVDGPAPEDR